MSLMADLKSDTAAHHHSVESRLRILHPEFSLADYRSLLLTFLGFYRGCESRLVAATSGTPLETFVRERLKAQAIEQDLRAMGCDERELQQVPAAAELPELTSAAAALGAMYVMEGATLGGTIIARHMRQHFGWENAERLHFFSFYGSEVGQRWRAFGELVEAQASEENSPAIRQAACSTFACLDAWLAQRNAELGNANEPHAANS